MMLKGLFEVGFKATVAFALLNLAACGGGAQNSAIPTLTYTVGASGYSSPTSTESGLVEVRLDNATTAPHLVAVVRPKAGVTAEQVKTTLAQGGFEAVEELVEMAGGVSAQPGQAAAVVLELRTGAHLLVGLKLSQDGPPEIPPGAVRDLEVKPRSGPAPAAPKPDVTAVGKDFSYEMPSSIKAGPKLWLFDNQGQHLHHLILFRLEEGKTLDDLKAWLADPQAAPPGEEAGFLLEISGGYREYARLDLPPGNYAAICFIVDHHSGKSHADLGMIQALTVTP